CDDVTYTITSYNPGTISTSQNVVCYNGNVSLSLNGSQNASGAIWQKCTENCSNDANWFNVGAVTGSPLQATNLVLPTNFRTKLTYTPCGGGSQVTSYSPVKEIGLNTSQEMAIVIQDPDGTCPNQIGSLTIGLIVSSSVIGQNPTFDWYRNNSLVNHNSSLDPKIYDPASPNYDFTENDQVQLKVTSGPSCVQWSNIATIDAGTDQVPSLNSIVSTPQVICEGQQVIFTVNAGGSNLSGEWHIGSGGFSFSGTNYPLNADDVDGLAVHFSTQLSGACGINHLVSTSTSPISVASLPHVNASDDELCTGQSTSIELSSDIANTTFSWTVSHNNTSSSVSSGIGSTINQVLNVVSGDLGTATYTVIPTSSNGCIGPAFDVHANVTPSAPNPTIQAIQVCDFDMVTLSADLTALISDYNWYNAQDILIGQGPKHIMDALPSGSYTFKVQAISVMGCTGNTSSPFTVNVVSSCDNLNWIETTNYSVTGSGPFTPEIVSHGRRYFDLSGAPLQTQTKNITRNEILSAVTVNDEFGRTAVNSLAAPTNSTTFLYKHWFARTADDKLFDYKKLGSPLGAQPGTVGWYYSSSNTKETNVPNSPYPYSGMEYSKDGSNEPMMQAAPGEETRLGMNHEIRTASFPVRKELDDYAVKRIQAIPGIAQDGSFFDECIQTVVRDQNGKYSVSISDKSGSVLMNARFGASAGSAMNLVNVIDASDATEQEVGPHMVYFYVPEAVPVTKTETMSADYFIEDLATGAPYNPAQASWDPGFYRIILNSGSIQLSYNTYLHDVSYSFFDDAGRLVRSVAPNSITPGWNIANADKKSFKYNQRGWLLSMEESDAGVTEYVYRKDGKIRFSQNAVQREKHYFSYTHYDKFGRPVESGEYRGTQTQFKSMTHSSYSGSSMALEVEKTYDQIAWAPVDMQDWIKTHYDEVATGVALPITQQFVRGAVSFTENINMRTYYSYDEMGR
ncbi:MAG TPA: PKD-like domain-containing protein, partial [Chryseolinea sp.]|nr:PKD-like domain-containing protein [Chryseolinea sp.]